MYHFPTNKQALEEIILCPIALIAITLLREFSSLSSFFMRSHSSKVV